MTFLSVSAFAQQRVNLKDLGVKLESNSCKPGDYACQAKYDQSLQQQIRETKVGAKLTVPLVDPSSNSTVYLEGKVTWKSTDGRKFKMDAGGGVFVQVSF